MEPHVLEWIKERVALPKDHVTMLDLDCRMGEDLAELAAALQDEGVKITTYGVEPKIQLSHKARERLDKVLPGGYLMVEMTHGVFSLVYCHPLPTQEHSGSDAGFRSFLASSRERAIFDRCTTYLATDGILIFRVRIDSLPALANVIAFRLQDVQFLFVDRDRGDRLFGSPYRDVVILGRKAPMRVMNSELRAKTSQFRRVIEELAELPVFPQPGPPEEKMIPPRSNGPKLFRSKVIDPLVMADDMRRSGLWREFESWAEPMDLGGHHPPLPLHMGHIGLLLSTGLLDGKVGNHIMKGRVVKRRHTESEVDEDGFIVDSATSSYGVQVRVLLRSGSYIDL